MHQSKVKTGKSKHTTNLAICSTHHLLDLAMVFAPVVIPRTAHRVSVFADRDSVDEAMFGVLHVETDWGQHSFVAVLHNLPTTTRLLVRGHALVTGQRLHWKGRCMTRRKYLASN